MQSVCFEDKDQIPKLLCPASCKCYQCQEGKKRGWQKLSKPFLPDILVLALPDPCDQCRHEPVGGNKLNDHILNVHVSLSSHSNYGLSRARPTFCYKYPCWWTDAMVAVFYFLNYTNNLYKTDPPITKPPPPSPPLTPHIQATIPPSSHLPACTVKWQLTTPIELV